MLTNIQETQLRMRIDQLTKHELKSFIIGNARTIADMKDLLEGARELLGCFQEGSLTAKRHEGEKIHEFTFSVTDALIAANPELTQIATVIATQVHNYIKAKNDEKKPDPINN